jgi:hypothetical protein
MASLCGKMNTVQHHVKFNQSIEKQGKFKWLLIAQAKYALLWTMWFQYSKVKRNLKIYFLKTIIKNSWQNKFMEYLFNVKIVIIKQKQADFIIM